MRVEAILVAAGTGTRLNRPEPKAFVMLAGHPLVWHAIKGLLDVEEIERLMVVVPAGWEEPTRALSRDEPWGKRIGAVVAGGARRQDSVFAGLQQLQPQTQIVLVHDAARPFAPSELIRRIITAAGEHGAAVPGLEVTDTIKVVDGQGMINGHPDRRTLRAVQTPQGFRTEWLMEAYHAARARGLEATDDAAWLETVGRQAVVVPGHPGNFKITHPQELEYAEWLLAAKP